MDFIAYPTPPEEDLNTATNNTHRKFGKFVNIKNNNVQYAIMSTIAHDELLLY